MVVIISDTLEGFTMGATEELIMGAMEELIMVVTVVMVESIMGPDTEVMKVTMVAIWEQGIKAMEKVIMDLKGVTKAIMVLEHKITDTVQKILGMARLIWDLVQDTMAVMALLKGAMVAMQTEGTTKCIQQDMGIS